MNLIMSYDIIPKIKGLLLDPTETLNNLREEPIESACVFFIAIAVISTVLTAIISLLNPIMANAAYLLGYLVGTFVGLIIGLVIATIILHIFVYICGGRKGLGQTLKAVIYSYTPVAIIGWIPFIGIISIIWSFILEILAIREFHEISTTRAALAVIIPMVLMIIILVIVIAFFLVSVSTSTGAFPIPQM